MYDAADDPVMTSINYSASPFDGYSPIQPFVSSTNASTVVFSFLLSESGEYTVTLCVMNEPVGWEQSLRIVSSTLDPSLSSVELEGSNTPTIITSEAITAAMHAKGDELGVVITNDVMVRNHHTAVISGTQFLLRLHLYDISFHVLTVGAFTRPHLLQPARRHLIAADPSVLHRGAPNAGLPARVPQQGRVVQRGYGDPHGGRIHHRRDVRPPVAGTCACERVMDRTGCCRWR